MREHFRKKVLGIDANSQNDDSNDKAQRGTKNSLNKRVRGRKTNWDAAVNSDPNWLYRATFILTLLFESTSNHLACKEFDLRVSIKNTLRKLKK